MSIEIKPIASLKDNYIWAIIDNNAREVIIIDPGDAKPVEAFLKQHSLRLSAILITHHHWDHTNGVSELKKRYNPMVYAPAHDNVKDADILLTESSDGIEFLKQSLSFSILDIPGHTLGHIAYYSPGMLFCGDTLFAAGCGRLFEGTAEQLYTSLQKMAALPNDTKVYCAHEYTLNNLRFAAVVEPNNQAIQERIDQVTALQADNLPSLPSLLAEEKLTNPFLRCNVKDVIAAAEKFAGEKLSTPVEVFAALRKWKDGF
jgi:hydroxyacylglutathione hydrolase